MRSRSFVFLVRNSCADKAHRTTQAGHRFGSKLMLIHIFFRNALNWPKWKSKHVKNFMDSESSAYKTTCSIRTHLNLFFACHWMFWAFQHFLHSSHHFWTWKTTHFQEALSTFQSFHSISTPVERNVGVGMLYFQVFQLIGMPKLQVKQHTLVHYKISLKNPICYSLIQSRMLLSRLYSRYT